MLMSLGRQPERTERPAFVTLLFAAMLFNSFFTFKWVWIQYTLRELPCTAATCIPPA